MNKDRLSGLDLYRIIAVAFVIINHCNSKVLLQVAPKSLAWYVTVGVIFMTKVAVPGFFMITGYNLLHRKEDVHVYFGRIRRIASVLVVFTLFYYVWRCMIHTIYICDGTPGAFDYILGYFKVLWQGGATDAFWYLYTYLGLLIMMPALQAVASRISGDDSGDSHATGGVSSGKLPEGSFGNSPSIRGVSSGVWRFVAVIALISLCVIPTLTIIWPNLGYSSYFELPGICSAVIYLFIGHVCYLSRERIGAGCGIKSRDLVWITIAACGFMFNMVMGIAAFGRGVDPAAFSEIHTVGMLVESVSVFVFLLKMKPSKASDARIETRVSGDEGAADSANAEVSLGAAGRIIGVMAPTTFGIYLFADFMCSNTHMIYYLLCQYMNRLFAVLIQDVAAFVCAFILVWLLRLIPVVRKYV